MLALVALTTGCQSKTTSTSPAPSGVAISVDGGSYVRISAARLNSMLKAKNFLLINVHAPYDGEITPTDEFIPYDSIEKNQALLPGGKDTRIVVYCRSGYMSAVAATTLVGLGYTNVMDMDGGMTAWQKAGFPLTRR